MHPRRRCDSRLRLYSTQTKSGRCYLPADAEGAALERELCGSCSARRPLPAGIIRRWLQVDGAAMIGAGRRGRCVVVVGASAERSARRTQSSNGSPGLAIHKRIARRAIHKLVATACFCLRADARRDRVVSPSAPWVAAAQPTDPQPGSHEKCRAFPAGENQMRTGWLETASRLPDQTAK